jgi:hypothetical protein
MEHKYLMNNLCFGLQTNANVGLWPLLLVSSMCLEHGNKQH